MRRDRDDNGSAGGPIASGAPVRIVRDQMSSRASVVEPATAGGSRGDDGEPTESERGVDPEAHRLTQPTARSAAPLHHRERDRYEVLHEHGRGGIGRVFRARDRELGRDVALKELLNGVATSEIRFFREALITARLEHPGIVPVHDAGRWPDGTPFYAMKLVHGRPLGELIDACRTPEDRLALLPHIIAVADAIAYAHDRKIIHRDLKPSNVIVGAFGETVVIDWGLAKDLTESNVDAPPDGPYRTPASDGLTAPGGVLGTPAYMAPEQHAGRADERTDVYALGGMIFHALVGRPPHSKKREADAPPALPRATPRDLAAVVRRAMATDPADRYQRAQDLAADLRQFTRRRPVAARRYSLAGRALLAFVRHRATSVVAVVALAALSIVLALDHYRVGSQRARAIASEERTQDALGQLTLKHAELLLSSDPSAAIDVLATYRGSSDDVVRKLRAEAIANGVAALRAAPHADNVLWLGGGSNGAVVSLSLDGTITETTRGGASRVVARGVKSKRTSAYAPAQHLLAYACDPDDVCMFDISRSRVVAADVLRGLQPDALSFSPAGNRLAVLSHDGILHAFGVGDPAHPSELRHLPSKGAFGVLFVDDDRVATASPDGITIQDDRATLAVPLEAPTAWDRSSETHRLVVGNKDGEAIVIETSDGSVTSRARPCTGKVNGLRFIPQHHLIGYVCRSGAVGTWDPDEGATVTRAQLEGGADVLDVGDDLLVAGGSNGDVIVVDLVTDLVSSYRGHGIRITSVAAPTPDSPLVTSGDVRGGVRAWPVPARLGRVVGHLDSMLVDAVFDTRSSTVLATASRPSFLAFSADRGPYPVAPHERQNLFFVPAPDHQRFATFGFGPKVEIWSANTLARERVVETPHGTVSMVRFVGHSDDFISAGHDGRLLLWSDTSPARELAHLATPIGTFVVIRGGDDFVVQGTDGAVLRISSGGDMHELVPPTGRGTMLQATGGG